ncbi:hypothetical protein VTN02DRAFT_3180 [Thermoascus thermophilus]
MSCWMRSSTSDTRKTQRPTRSRCTSPRRASSRPSPTRRRTRAASRCRPRARSRGAGRTSSTARTKRSST